MTFTFRSLSAWEKGMALVERCYQLSSRFPVRETYGLASQIRRAAVSIPSNIAEGHSRRSTGAYLNHVSIALGSQGELETCIELAHRLKFIDRAEWETIAPQMAEVGRLLYGLHRALERKHSSAQ